MLMFVVISPKCRKCYSLIWRNWQCFLFILLLFIFLLCVLCAVPQLQQLLAAAQDKVKWDNDLSEKSGPVKLLIKIVNSELIFFQSKTAGCASYYLYLI